MGDEGKLYNGVTPATIQSMLEMIAVADLIFPNHTEACYLTGSEYHAEGVSKQEAHALLDKLHATGAKSVLITSIPVEGQHCVAGYNDLRGEYFLLPYTEIPVHFPGTGDIFSAVLIGNLLNGKALRLATRIAMDRQSAAPCHTHRHGRCIPSHRSQQEQCRQEPRHTLGELPQRTR